MYVSSPKGELYGFCPAKVARDDFETTSLYNMLIVIAETGQLLESNGISNQPAWLIDELSWFLPKYSAYKFANQISMVFGSDDKPNQTKPKQATRPGQSKKPRRGV